MQYIMYIIIVIYKNMIYDICVCIYLYLYLSYVYTIYIYIYIYIYISFRTKHVSVDICALNLFIEHSGER